MSTQDAQVKQILAGNEQVRKKLQTFRSGIQKLMNKQAKKASRHQAPSHDTKPWLNKKQHENASSMNKFERNKKAQISKQSQFGFNSTLFKQLGNDSGMMSNSSGGVQNINYNSNYNSVNSLSNKQYWSTQSKDQKGFYQKQDDQSFKKSFKIFSQIDDLMNKVSKTSKLPTKPIQKYIQKKDQIKNASSILQNLNFDIPKSHFNSKDGLSPLGKRKQLQKLKTIQEIDEQVKRKKRQKKGLYSDKQLKQRLQITKIPPLPKTSNQGWLYDKKQRGAEQLRDKYNFIKENKSQQRQLQNYSSVTDNISSYYQSQNFNDTLKNKQNNFINKQFDSKKANQKEEEKSPSKISLYSQNSSTVQIHRNKLKQALSGRKQMLRQQKFMNNQVDDSIQLQLSSEEQQQSEQKNKLKQGQQGVGQNRQKAILRLQQQKLGLLRELKQVEQELERLQSQ